MMEQPGVRIPAMILSASVTPETRERARNAGADDFVGKPFDAASLLEKIDKLAAQMTGASAGSRRNQSSRNVVTQLRDRDEAHVSGSENKLLDPERLVELEEISRDANFMTELLRGFKSDVEDLVRRLRNSVSPDATESTGDVLHALKGAAVGIGAIKLSRVCDNFPRSQDRHQSTAREAVDQVEFCAEATFIEVAQYVKQRHKVLL
jgi:two-component system sensor histidine kinase RpfC